MDSVGVLLGREVELRVVARLLGKVRNGHGGSLLLTGPPGIGKTALLDESLTAAYGVRVLRVDGFESEAAMPFAAVHRLTLALREHLPGLRDRLREALDVAAGEVDGPPPDRFLVGLAVLSLLSGAAQETPVVCAIDDVHLLDSDSLDVLAFVGRRLDAEPVALVFAGRDQPDTGPRVDGVERVTLTGLDARCARALLERSVCEPIEASAAMAVVRATGGNPLALIDLAQELSAHELDELGIDDEPIPVGRHLEAHYVRRVREAESAVQEWLLVAAAESTGDVDVIGRAAEMLGLPADTQESAERAGLVELRGRVRFRHPLVRSAVYRSASAVERRLVHRTLAAVAHTGAALELEAWHLSRATVGVNAEAAHRMELGADVARRRGGHASRASILSRAAELTAPGSVRDARNLGATESALEVGMTRLATRLLERVDGDRTDPVSRGRAIVARCAIGMAAADPQVVLPAASMLIRAADEFRGEDSARELRALQLAFDCCTVTARLTQDVSPDEVGKRLDEAARRTSGPESVITAGLAALIVMPYEAAVPPARAALEMILALPENQMMNRGTVLAALSAFLWDESARDCGLGRATAAARDVGALPALDSLLGVVSLTALGGGSTRAARDCLAQVDEVRTAMGRETHDLVTSLLALWTGALRQDVPTDAQAVRTSGLGGAAAAALAALGLRDLAEGGYADAYRTLRPLVEDPFLHTTATTFPDFVEAACRTGRSEEARPYVARLLALAEANGSPWCLGVAQRSRALVTATARAEKHFVAALESLGRTECWTDLGRAHLVYGEWLRRARRRPEAQRELRRAEEIFVRSGAEAFAGRASRELDTTGATTAPRPTEPLSLTAQESTVARLAAGGHTNNEIATELFISPNTVDYHLRKVFAKLGISSRRQLFDRLTTG